MKNYIRDIYIILIIVMIGALVRFPITNVRDIDTSILYDPDSYLYARLAEEFYDEPMSEWHFITYRVDDSTMNMVNSESNQFVVNLLPILVAFICKIFSFLNIQDVIFYFNIFLCPLSAIPAYIFTKKYTNTFGGIVAGLAMSTSASFFLHTIYGYFDTDALIMFLATILILATIDNYLENNFSKQILLSLTILSTVALFSVSWEVYYFYVAVALAIGILMLIVNRIFKYDLNVKIPILTSALMIGECFVLSGKNLLSSFVRAIVTVFSGSSSNWPDESKFIGELVAPSFIKGGPNNSFLIHVTGVVNWLGGIPFFIATVIFALTLLISCIVKKKRSSMKKEIVIISIVLFVWSLAVSIIIPSGIRFVQLLALPFNLILGIGFGIFYDKYKDEKIVTWKKNLIVLLLSILFFGSFMLTNVMFAIVLALTVLIIGVLADEISAEKILVLFFITIIACPVIDEYRISKGSQTFLEPGLPEAMNYINENTPEDSTIVVWWSDGYYIQYATKRQVVADGGIYNGAYFYWLSNIFATKDENLSTGICRMLQSGSLEAELIAEKYFGDAKSATSILKEILALDENHARDLLVEKYDLSLTETNELLRYTHPNEESDLYLVLTDNLKDISSVIAYFGFWDFENVKEYETTMDAQTGEYTYPKELDNSIMLKWIDGSDFKNYDMVYSNETVTVLKVNR